MTTISKSYEHLVEAGRAGIRFLPSWGTRRDLFSSSLSAGRFSAVLHAGAALCAFSGCDELAFTESRFGPVCEDHAGAALIR